MRKLKRIEFRFRRKVLRFPTQDIFLVLAVSYLIMATIHTSLDPYIEILNHGFMRATQLTAPISWSDYGEAHDYFQ